MELKFGGKLTKGDLLLVSDSNGLHTGIFAGFGRGTIQYYIPKHVLYARETHKTYNTKLSFYKAYFYGSNVTSRAAKITPEILNSEDLDQYLEAIDILKQENIIK